jgi:hypothetical protein
LLTTGLRPIRLLQGLSQVLHLNFGFLAEV